ncbi:MAG: hypothetical protein U9R41_01225 [Candidatus Marinimicrobia bacterium]|nr:hypothetical protein [Candidatus Neomarinimicrobiota bacterium]
MKTIELNLLGKAANKKKQRKLKFSIIFLYIAIWYFSIFILINIYETNSYMFSRYKNETDKISSELASTRSKLARIQFLYNKYKKIKLKENTYIESLYRPGKWLNKMISISKAIPDNITLDKLSVNPNATSIKDEKIILSGTVAIGEGINSLKQLNSFENNLKSNISLMKDFTKVEIKENEIITKDNRSIMSFSVGIF